MDASVEGEPAVLMSRFKTIVQRPLKKRQAWLLDFGPNFAPNVCSLRPTSTAAQMSHQGSSQSVAKDDAAWQFRSMKLTAVFEPAKEGGYTCFVEEIPAAISQGETLAEAKANLLDALKLVLACQRKLAEQDLSPNALRELLDFAET